MLNKDEFYRGLGDSLVKEALRGGADMIGTAYDFYKDKILSSVVGRRVGRGVGNVMGKGLDYISRNPTSENPTAPGVVAKPSFINELRAGVKDNYVGSRGQIDMANDVLNKSMGGAVQLNAQNKPEVQWGKALNHFGGQAMDWLKNNKGTAMLGGAGILGGGMLLANALGGNKEPQQPSQNMHMQSMPQQNRFAFNKPGGLTG